MITVVSQVKLIQNKKKMNNWVTDEIEEDRSTLDLSKTQQLWKALGIILKAVLKLIRGKNVK